jgi:hypothetical protein
LKHSCPPPAAASDYNDALNDKSGAISYYTSHFYDADTGMNYWGDGSPSAVERGRDFFMASMKVLTYPNGNVRFDIGRRTNWPPPFHANP